LNNDKLFCLNDFDGGLFCAGLALSKQFNSNYSFFVLKGILPNHTNKTRNNLPALVLVWFCNFHIHKRTDRNPRALFLLFGIRSRGK
jgi:hypothetical protein